MAHCTNCGRDVDPVAAADGSGKCCSFCGTPWGSADALARGTLINGFEILEEIGRGGMGVVYKARQLNLERDVAFKVLADDLANDAEFVERFFREARAAGSLNHPNIVQVYDAGSTPDGIYYFIMELITGDTLEKRITRDGSIPPKESLRIAIRIAAALDYAWEYQKLAHGDIKPENIIMNNAGNAKLADLGLAKWAHDEASSGGLMATPLYAPPEIIRGESNVEGFRSDMYSFGVTLFHMLAGTTPFPDDDPDKVLDMHLAVPPPPITQYQGHIAPAFANIIDSLLEKDPFARPESWKHVIKALKKIRSPETGGKVFRTHGHEPEHAEPTIEPPSSSNTALSNLIKLLAAFTVLLVVILGAIIVRTSTHATKPTNANPTAQNTPQSNKAEQAWKKLKPLLATMDTSAAFSALTQLHEKYGDTLPEEARAALEEKRQLAQQEQERAKELENLRQNFNAELDSLLEDLAKVDVEDESDDTIPLLKKLVQRITKVEQMSAQEPTLEITQDNKEIIDEKYKMIVARLKDYRKKLRRQAIEKAAKERRERLAALAQKQAEEEKARQKNLLECALIDKYYLALANYQETHLISELEKLATWGKSTAAPPPAYSERVAFINDVLLPNAQYLSSVLRRHSDELVSKRLPKTFCVDKRAPLIKFKIKGVDEAGIKLFMSKNKVTIGQTVKWSSLTPSDLLFLTGALLLADGTIPLTKKDIKVTLAFTVLRTPKQFESVYKQAKQRFTNLNNIWPVVKDDFLAAPREKKAIEKFYELRSALLKKGSPQSLAEFFDLLSSQAELRTEFHKRYNDEFARLLKDIAPSTPAVKAWQLIEQCEAMANTQDKFNAAMVIQARFTNILPLMGKKTIARVNNIKNRTLAYMMRNSGVKSVSDNRVPFYYWAKEKQGAAWAYYKILLKSGKLKQQKSVINSLLVAAAFDNGDWPSALQSLNAKSMLSKDIMRQGKIGLAWGPSLLFAKGMVLQRLGNGQKRGKVLNSFELIIKNIPQKTKLQPLAASLALEYALATRQTRQLLHKYSPKFRRILDHPKSKSELRFALLHYLVLLENPDTPPGKIRKTGYILAKTLLSASKKMAGDAAWLKTAADLATGANISENRLAATANTKLYFKDTDARIMASAMARRHAANQNATYTGITLDEGNPTPGERKLLAAILSRLTPNIVGGDLWRRASLLSMASCSSLDEMAKSIELAPSKKIWISTTPFYSSLLILKAGANVAADNISRKTAIANLKHYLDASPTTSSAEMRMISAPLPQVVKELFNSNQPEKAVVAGIFGIMISGDDPKPRSAIIKELWDHYKMMTWEERWLILRVQNWRLQCLEY